MLIIVFVSKLTVTNRRSSCILAGAIVSLLHKNILPAVPSVLHTPAKGFLLPWHTWGNQNVLFIEQTQVFFHLFQISLHRSSANLRKGLSENCKD
jgi:hypothetical protein